MECSSTGHTDFEVNSFTTAGNELDVRFNGEKKMAENINKIRGFIFDNFLFDAEDEALKNDTSFLEEGIIDSTGVLELVDWLEEEFSISVEDDELIPENLDSVNLLSAYIIKKMS